LKAVKFITSPDIQKEYIIKNNILSAITSLYDDEEVCRFVNCHLVKSSQPFSTLIIDTPDFKNEYYIEKYKKYMFEYLYNDKDISEVLNDLNNVLSIHYLTISPNESSTGFSIFLVFIIIAIIMFSSLICLYIDGFKSHFKILPKDFWIISVMGSFMLMCSVLTVIGKATGLKCYLRLILVNLGFTLGIIPIFYKFIVNFPEDNKLSNWVEKHRYKFLSIILFIEIPFLIMFLFSPYTVKTLGLEYNENFQICKLHTLGEVLFYIIVVLKSIIILTNIFLVFVEWSIEETIYDTKFLMGACFVNMLSLIIYICISRIEIGRFIAYHVVVASNLFVCAISNYIFLYAIRIIHYFSIKKTDEKETYIKEL